jgi:predicted DNA-binding protein
MAAKTAEISMRLEPELRDRIRRKAESLGMTMAEYMRSLTLRDLKLSVDEPRCRR